MPATRSLQLTKNEVQPSDSQVCLGWLYAQHISLHVALCQGSTAAQAAEVLVGLSVPHHGSRFPARGAQTHLWSLHSWLETGEVSGADAEKGQCLLESLFPKANLGEGQLGQNSQLRSG